VTASIEVDGVGRRYGNTWALRDASFTLGPGVTGLLGPNGAGKTTLLRILATALAPTTGCLSLLGLDPSSPGQQTRIRRQLGYLPQELGFPRGFTVFAFVDYIAVLKEWTRPDIRHQEVARVLDAVGLTGCAAKRIRTLSGGQRRRLGLAQALLGAPRILVLDEPTTGLDPEQRATLRAVLAEVAREAVVVLSTHQTEDLAALCERVVLLDGGTVNYDGSVLEFVGQAAGRVWLAAAPDPRARASWRTGTGRYRNIAEQAPPGAELVEPTLEDAYLLLRGSEPTPVATR
jgi:ABC-2 type transport system ATP-binding protein